MAERNLKINFEAFASAKKVVIKIEGNITGWKNSAEEFKQKVKDAIDAGIKDCEVYVNSPGGLVFDAFEIYNEIKKFPGTITTKAGAICASAGTIILIAGEERIGTKNSQYMLHRPEIDAYGNEDELDSKLKLLRNLQETIAQAYADATGMKKEAIVKIWQKEYWMNAEEALTKNFITKIEGETLNVKNEEIDEIIGALDINKVPAAVVMQLNAMKETITTKTTIENKNNKTDMNVEMISTVLNNKDVTDDASAMLAIQDIVATNKRLESENKTLKDAAQKQKDDAAEALVLDAIRNNKIKESEKEEYIAHAKLNYDLTRKLLEAKGGYVSASSKMEVKGGGADPYAEWDYGKFMKDAPAELKRIQEKEPERFARLKNEYVAKIKG